MKVIDLLVKIAKGEEVPNYIRYFNKIERNKLVMLVCKSNIIYRLDETAIDLNDEIEIIEENTIPEKLEEPKFNKGRYYIKDINGDNSEISGIERTLRLKINEIIDYLKSKGE